MIGACFIAEESQRRKEDLTRIRSWLMKTENGTEEDATPTTVHRQLQNTTEQTYGE